MEKTSFFRFQAGRSSIPLSRLADLALHADFRSGISTDIFGDQLIADLRASNVDTQFCIRSDRPSTLAFVTLNDGQAQYTFMDENSAGRMLDAGDLPELPEELEALHFGAISLIPEPCGTTYETLMAKYHERAVISLDPNIRPGFIADPDAHRARIRRMAALSDVVKVSDEDLEWLMPDVDPQSAIDAMLKAGPCIVILTKGALGVDVHTLNGKFSVGATDVQVVDTIGAGDSFNGGFLAGLRRAGILTKTGLRRAGQNELRPAVKLAANVAAITVSRAGANPPWEREIREIASKP